MKPALLVAALAGAANAALNVDLNSPASIKAAARRVVDEMMGRWYTGNQTGQTPGILPGPPPGGPYYWWQGGALWGTLIDYWHYTGDPSYNHVVTQAILHQAAPPSNSFQHPNWTISLGNDDQGFWGMTAMLAAELNFPNPPAGQPGWLTLAQGVHNTQAAPERHDKACGGGMRWQVPISNPGYDYKNAIANGIFLNMAARLVRYTGNEPYTHWVDETWDWMWGVGIISPDYDIYDGGHEQKNCTDIFKAQFSYNAAVMLQGAAVMYNYTETKSPKSDLANKWKVRVDGLVNRTLDYFFLDGIAIEHSCELPDSIQCKTDMLSFKGYLFRWLAYTAQICPHLKAPIQKSIKTSMAAAIKSCNGNVCSFRWTSNTFDPEHSGAGEQMNMIAGLSVLLMDEQGITGPLTNKTGGTSQGDPNAGFTPSFTRTYEPITTGSRAGAGILTFMIITGLIAVLTWVSGSWNEHGGGAGAPKRNPLALPTMKAAG